MEYSGDYESKQHLLNGQTIFRINYIREFGKKATLYVDPGISLMNYRLQNERMKYVWTFRTNTWVRYRFNSLHWIGVGFSHHNNQPEISIWRTGGLMLGVSVLQGEIGRAHV